MNKIILLCLLFLVPIMMYAQPYKKLHFNSIVVDTHNDLLSLAIDDGYIIDQDLSGKTNSDLDRFKKGGVDVQFFSVWCDGNKQNPFAWANREMDTLDAVARRNPGKITLVGNTEQLMKAVKENKLAALYGVEGGHMIENKLENLDKLYKRGVRYMTLTWNNSNDWATSALDETTKADSLKHKGLTEFGRQVVKRMNELGMMIDLSHVGEQTFKDAIAATTKPILVSHSCVYNICPHRRNLKDYQIQAIGKNGGVIQLNFYSGFIDSSFERHSALFNQHHQAERDSLLKVNPEPYYADVFLFSKYPDEVKSFRPSITMLIDHLDYIVKMIGVDHVGFGSDFDGVNSLPKELDDITNMPLLTEELLKRGYSKEDIQKILGGNLLRVFEANKPI